MAVYKVTGGAKVGIMLSTYPFAVLKIEDGLLRLNVSLVAKLVFRAQDIISIEPFKGSGKIGDGIKINHRVPGYKENVLFWCSRTPEVLIREIQGTGFFMSTNYSHGGQPELEILESQKDSSGNPIKTKALVLMTALWLFLLIPNIMAFLRASAAKKAPSTTWLVSPMFVFFAFSVLLLISGGFRDLVLKEGRTLEDVKSFAVFLALISGLILVVNLFVFNRFT
jgi:hypothetical protein